MLYLYQYCWSFSRNWNLLPGRPSSSCGTDTPQSRLLNSGGTTTTGQTSGTPDLAAVEAVEVAPAAAAAAAEEGGSEEVVATAAGVDGADISIPTTSGARARLLPKYKSLRRSSGKIRSKSISYDIQL